MLQQRHVVCDSSFDDGVDVVANPGWIFPDIFRTFYSNPNQVQIKSGKFLTRSLTESKPSSCDESQTHVFAVTLSSVSGLLKISSKKVNITDS